LVQTQINLFGHNENNLFGDSKIYLRQMQTISLIN
jgi:hypothetical protein